MQMNTAVDDDDANATSVQTVVPGNLRIHRRDCVVQMRFQLPVPRDIANFGIVGQRCQFRSGNAGGKCLHRVQDGFHLAAMVGDFGFVLVSGCRRELHNDLHGIAALALQIWRNLRIVSESRQRHRCEQ